LEAGGDDRGVSWESEVEVAMREMVESGQNWTVDTLTLVKNNASKKCSNRMNIQYVIM